MSIRVEMKGVKDAVEGLNKVSEFVKQKPVLDRAMKQALKPMLNQAKYDAPEGETGELAKSIGVRSAKIRNRKTTSGAVQFGVYAPHAWLVENGSGPRHRKDNGQFTGIMPPNFFFKIAQEQHKAHFNNELGKHIVEETEKAVKRYLRK